MFTRCSKKLSAVTNTRHKSVLYIEVFLWEFDRDLTGSLQKCSLLPGVRYTVWLLSIGLTVFISTIAFECLLFSNSLSVVPFEVTFMSLTHFMSLFSFFNPWKQKISGFLMFLGVLKETGVMEWVNAVFDQAFLTWLVFQSSDLFKFGSLYLNFPCQNYLAVSYINTRNGYEKWKCDWKVWNLALFSKVEY